MSANDSIHDRAIALSGPGVSARAIAEQIGVAERTVERWRKAGLIPAAQPAPFPHGTVSGYNRSCRCVECTAAATLRANGDRKKRFGITRSVGLPPHVKHGESAGKNWGCRCAICLQAVQDANRAYRQKIRTSR